MSENNFLNNVVDNAFGILDQFIEDKDAKQQAKHRMAELRLQAELELAKGQMAANVEAAKHSSFAVAAARPACIWAALFIIMYHYVGHPFLMYLGAFFPEANVAALPKPIDDTTELFYFLSALLGFSGLRSWEKGKGVARNNLSEPNQSPLP